MLKHLYIHIPFCDSICSYCDFNKRVSKDEIQYKYYLKLKEELFEYKDMLKNIETIFIGGGTPTAFNYLDLILEDISEVIDLSKVKEFTIESTPLTVLGKLDLFNKYSVNRISIGIESLNNKTLSYINRNGYDYKFINKVIKTLENEGISNINLDFIKGLPYENLASIKKSLRLIKCSDITHVSYYDLIIENKTKLYYDLSHFKITVPSESILLKMDKLINNRLNKYGFNRYEVSNYAKEGYESIHNSSYWTLDDYLGIGLESHSLINQKRYFNTSQLEEYLKIKDFKSNVIEEEFNYKYEYLILGLRLTKGIDLKEYKNLFKKDLMEEYPELNEYINLKYAFIENDRFKLTYDGYNVMNKILEVFN